MDKKVEKDILKHLQDSKDYWTDLFLILNTSINSYKDYIILLKSMSSEGLIKFRKESEINQLKFTMQGKLTSNPDLSAKITEKGINYLSRLESTNLKTTANKRVTIWKNIKDSSEYINRNLFYLIATISTLIAIYFALKEQFNIDLIQLIKNK